jgi:inosose dehydratase
MGVILGSAPDSWGVWFADDRKQTPWHRFLDEVAAAGYRWIELGPYGYLPTELEVLTHELDSRELRVTGTFTMFHFEEAVAWQARRDEVERTCDLLVALQAKYLILIDDVYTDLFTGDRLADSELDDIAWKRFIETTRRIADVATRRDLRPVLHPHAETHIEYEPQIERFLQDVNGEIDLCLDVGHHAYREGDPVAFIRKHHERIPYLHLKSVDREMQRRVAAEGVPFARAVAEGMFVEPSRGAVDFPALNAVLDEVGYDGFGIVEQDMYPAPFDKPFPIAKRTRQYLLDIGLGEADPKTSAARRGHPLARP